MKITKEQKEQILKLREKGLSLTKISKQLGISISLVYYHGSKEAKEKRKAHAKEWQKKNKNYRDKDNYKAYQKKYHADKYKNDPEYREKIKKLSREYQRKKLLDNSRH